MKIGIVGDIHEDIVALKAAFKIFELAGCNEVVCLGDIAREYDGIRILFSHFAYPDLHGVKAYFPKQAEEFLPHLAFMRQQNCMMGFSGHMHFEGVSVCTEAGMTRNGFGSYSLNKGLQWLFGPCAARCQFNNGVMILDTQTLLLQAVPLAKNTIAETADSDLRFSGLRVLVAHE